MKESFLQNDLQILLREPPTNRNLFYLARTYMDLKKYEEAINVFKMRIEKQGWEEEVYLSMFQIGLALQAMNQENEALGRRREA